MQTYLNITAKYLIFLLPAFLISGPLLSDSTVVLIDIIFLLLLYKENNFKYLNNSLFKFLLFFNIYISLRSLFAEDIFLSLKSSLFYIRFTIFIFAIKYFLERDKNLLSFFSKGIILTILILFIDSLFQYINGYNFLGFKLDNPDKLNSLFGDEGVLGSYLIRILPLFLVCFLNLNKNSFLFIAVIFIFGFFIFLAGSRSALALYILFFFIFVLIFTEYRKKLFILLGGIIVLSFLSVKIFNLSMNPSNMKINDADDRKKIENNLINKISYTIYYNFYDPIKNIFKNKNKLSEITIFTEVYEAHYRTAIKIFKDKVFFGAGNKMFRKLCSDDKYKINKYSCSTHPHNLYLQVLAENGLLGFVFVFIIFIYTILKISKEFFIRNFKKQNSINDQKLLLLIGLFINLWPIVPFGNFYNNWLSILIYLPIGFLLYFRVTNDK